MEMGMHSQLLSIDPNVICESQIAIKIIQIEMKLLYWLE